MKETFVCGLPLIMATLMWGLVVAMLSGREISAELVFGFYLYTGTILSIAGIWMTPIKIRKKIVCAFFLLTAISIATALTWIN